ncbi:hypothetical protein FEM48_Zijuj06G0075800 [Ziziphus jujuba var. spinosa]|uniref:RBR-type E3 ubiquitin transferase n=1 Tax=Ziziphus jujuba var. spinosa TaxID=714518 RepID=A0A978V802_ZIZJJ|nr:hypothetical protein FEM48_Zijuj06G0075800 [Ziziphus jujuba var. spinosa]
MDLWDYHIGPYLDRSVDEEETGEPLPSYKILNEADIRQRQEDDIERVRTALSVSKASAIVLLRHFNWNFSKLCDEWFDDEDGARNKTGLLLLTRPSVQRPPPVCRITCGICLDTFTESIVSWASCGHPYCRSCWGGYISKSIYNDGSGCLLLECPHPSCRAAVGEDMVNALVVDHSDKEKYSRYLLRSYVEDSYRKRKIKWCPAPGCDYAIDFVDFLGNSKGYDVHCRCSYSFCWNCNQEAHRPVDCDTVAKWIVKNNDESQNSDWILVNTKPCPECKRPIEKSLGCNHMTCSPPCKYEFCWTCLAKWSHKSAHICTLIQTTTNSETEKRDMVKASLVRYSRSYERWATNQKLRRKAMQYLRVDHAEQLEKLSSTYGQPKPLLRFIENAWQQVIECRRVLQWSFVYGYYLSEDEVAKTQFLEYLQGEAEHGLKRFIQCTETEMGKFVDGDGSVDEFIQYRSKLSELTSVIGKYFKNLVRAMEDGLSEVESHWVYWKCELCSFANGLSTTKCQMCFGCPV